MCCLQAWRDKGIATRYYNPDVHYASFLLASQLQTVLPSVPRLHQVRLPHVGNLASAPLSLHPSHLPMPPSTV